MKTASTVGKNGYEIKIVTEGDITETRITGYVNDEVVTTAIIYNKEQKITSSTCLPVDIEKAEAFCYLTKLVIEKTKEIMEYIG